MSVTAIHARIAAIEARFAVPPAVGSGAFATSFAAALSRTGTGGQTSPTLASPSSLSGVPSAPTASAGHTHVQPPAELVAYGNGRVPRAALAEIGVGSHRMWAPAAAAFQQMTADAAAAGVPIGVTDSYRSYDQQVDLAERKGLYSEGGLAADPGTSDHGWGLSLDLDLNSRAQAWMRANAGRYGFVEDVPREPWHWTFHRTGSRQA